MTNDHKMDKSVTMSNIFDYQPKLSKRGELEAFTERNWARLSPEVRARAVAELKSKMATATESLDLFEEWRQQYRDGYRIGSNMLLFHAHTGMYIRNLLRGAVLDNELEPVDYDGTPCQNWDDYYMAALREALDLPLES